MSKLERAVREASVLPPQIQDQLGEDLLHAIHRMLALQDELSAGIVELDRGEGIPAAELLADLKRRYGL